MKRLKYISLVISLGLILLNSCKKDDDYNWSSYQPVIFGTVNGPTSVSASGNVNFPSEYEMSYYRAGSTFTWSVTTYLGTGTATITTEDVEECHGKIASIVFPQRAVVDTAYISVVETPAKGKASEPLVQKVILNPFCPKTIDDFVGTFDAVETISGVPANISVVITKDDATTLRVNDAAGIPGLLSSVFTGWGETFVAGHGLDGDILIHVNLDNGVLTFTPGEYWGRSDYDYDYWYTGSGTWNGCTMVMNVTFALHWDNTNFNDAGDRISTTVIDLASKK